MFLDWFHYLLDTNVFLSSSSAHAMTKQSKYIFLNQLIHQVYSPPFVMATSSPSSIPPTHLCPYLSSGSFQSFHPSSPPRHSRLVFLFSIPTPPHPSPRSLPEFHRLVWLCWINLPLAKLLLDYVFFPFSQCNPFKLLPQQLIKHSNKTSICPPFPTPCPSPVSVKWWMAAKSGRQLWCNDTTAMASPTPPPTPGLHQSMCQLGAPSQSINTNEI